MMISAANSVTATLRASACKAFQGVESVQLGLIHLVGKSRQEFTVLWVLMRARNRSISRVICSAAAA